MNLSNEQEVEQTLNKIELLQQNLERIKRGETELNHAARELSMAGLQRTIKQMKEDIVRYQSRRELKVG